MEKLRATLARYSRWQTLEIYIERMEGHLETDFSISVENAKALLESIGKEICDAKGVALGNTPSINAVLKKAFVSLGYTAEELVTQMSGSLANIGQLIGNLRNEISPTSHGKSLEELKDRNNKVDSLTREFLIDSTLVVAVFLIRAFEEREGMLTIAGDSENHAIFDYNTNENFNTFWDDNFGDFAMGEYAYPASEILFTMEPEAYQMECRAFLESEDDTAEGEA
ncbi:abortive infection family protein [Pseudomonas antarctica]|uniref:abortive infection family protein n=1 Tax=Pseudomonas antarctica TaxID=219572 RepID=UPI00345D2EA1